jgi:hypothetical protein
MVVSLYNLHSDNYLVLSIIWTLISDYVPSTSSLIPA